MLASEVVPSPLGTATASPASALPLSRFGASTAAPLHRRARPQAIFSTSPLRWFRLLLPCQVLLAILLSTAAAGAQELKIGILAPPQLLASPVARSAVQDCLSLLAKGFPGASVTLNPRDAQVLLVLPRPTPAGAAARIGSPRPYPVLQSTEADFSWRWTRRGDRRRLLLAARTPEAVSAGLYALLQEKLGFGFVHPRQTVFPAHSFWPLADRGSFSGRPRFPQRGFHLHTLHPTELTEQLHDPRIPGALKDVTDYLDWLARNGQNTFQFFLLREVDRKSWPAHARNILAYAKRRGIKCGIEISLAMLQQQSFQAITLLQPFPSYRSQVDRSLAWLFQAPWDFVTLEATLGEHLPLIGKFLPAVQAHLEEVVNKRYGARLFYATHVIGPEDLCTIRRPELPDSGILIHTVMSYSASEPKAPVYGNLNQCFMLDAARCETGRRETWYWPESSYWVCFDSSVPLLLLTYLDSRWDDMQQMERIGIRGHLTFSSGWEWGYWLVDWSIARWSWTYLDNGARRPSAPLSRLSELFSDRLLDRYWKEALALQNLFLKEQELQRYLSALTPFSELPPPLHRPFQPEPGFRYSWLLEDASADQAAAAVSGPIQELECYGRQMRRICDQIDARLPTLKENGMPGDLLSLAEELSIGLRVGALRAGQRAATLRALLAKRSAGPGSAADPITWRLHLERAARFRLDALTMVRRQEQNYRFPRELLTMRRPSLTAYGFGYLYPAATLFFWEREEEQVRRSRFDPLIMNIWDVRRTLGLGSLFSN